MCECIDLGLRHEVKFTRAAYHRAAAEVARQANYKITRLELKRLMQGQRRKFRQWEELGREPRARWDDGLEQWTLGPAEWDELIRRKSQMRQFRWSTLRWRPLLWKLWGGAENCPVVPAQRRC